MARVVASRWLWVGVIGLGNWCAVAAASAQQPTTIIVTLPADARLEINGRATSAAGKIREFRDSQAQPGGIYRYVLRASIERGGRRASQERLLRLRAGDREQVTFQFVQPVVVRKEITPPVNALAQAAQFQPRFQPRTGDSNPLPELPPVGDPTDDALPPLTTGDTDLPTDSGLRTTQPELPSLGEPTPGQSRFGRQFGDESDQTAPTDDELPLIDDPAAGEPSFDTPPATTETQGGTTKALTEQPGNDRRQVSAANLLAYVGHDHLHQFVDDTGSALHVWQHRWRMVRLRRATSAVGPYAIYHEIDHPGYDWAYGMQSLGCRDFPVFFKPGHDAAWCFIGYANRVRPFSN